MEDGSIKGHPLRSPDLPGIILDQVGGVVKERGDEVKG
jgi:hypothetical protein